MSLPATDSTSPTLYRTLKRWGENSFNPMILSALIAAQNLRPFRPLPMLFPPALIGTSFLSIHEYKTDSGGLLAAESGLYALLALRRKQAFARKFSPRGALRGITLGLCAVNVAAGGLAYTFGDRKAEDERRITDDD